MCTSVPNTGHTTRDRHKATYKATFHLQDLLTQHTPSHAEKYSHETPAGHNFDNR